MFKWLKKLRALPSDPQAEDTLKVEYVVVNLNNSRKLISNVSRASAEATALGAEKQKIVEGLLPLRTIRNELSWLDGLVESRQLDNGSAK